MTEETSFVGVDDRIPKIHHPTNLDLGPNLCPRVTFITANVGSIFEEPGKLIPQWMDQIMSGIQQQDAKFVGIHCQEVGGKNPKKCMEHVNGFVNKIVTLSSRLNFDRVVAFFDDNYSASDKFTALGCIYLIHESLSNLELYNFQECHFNPVTASYIHLGSVDDIPTLEKRKFPLNYFPDSRWSRKGYLRTRWRIASNVAFDLVNIHLFHDACNIKSVESEGPSIYMNYRQRALQYTLDQIQDSSSPHCNVPFFIFGDFNFRLHARGVVDALNVDLRVKVDNSNEAEADNIKRISNQTTTESLSNNTCQSNSTTSRKKLVLILGTKEFSLGDNDHDHDVAFLNGWKRWTEFDHETLSLQDRLTEFPLNFPPTYPFQETDDDGFGKSYMKTRCPAWCDRVLLSHDACEKLVVRQYQNCVISSTDPIPAEVTYNVIGQDICMGDHKPVFLSFYLNTVSDYQCSPMQMDRLSQNESSEVERELPPSIESPSYTDLLPIYPRYKEIKETVPSLKLFKETTV